MPYEPTVWNTGDEITAPKLNNVEQGIADVHSEQVTHTTNTSNPHAVTAAQVGALPTTEKGAANGVASLNAQTRVVQDVITVGGVFVRNNAGVPEWSMNGTTWNTFGPTEAEVQAIAASMALVLGG